MSSDPGVKLRDYIALSIVTGIGSRTAAVLLEVFGSAPACFEADRRSLEEAGLKQESINALKSSEARERADKELEELKKQGAVALTIEDENYPALLRETYDPPIVLYALGDFTHAIEQPVTAIVGSRHCSTYGKNAAEMLSRQLSERGITIASGLARGIDTAAHRGAIEGGGLTIAVMGTGLDTIYPKENRKLADKVVQQGALVTEFPLGTPPLSQNFPFRNRVISGISLGVMVVEGAERSGSLITARLAIEQGRDVYAVPGNITSSKSFGPNYLIKDGAKLVQSWRDVVEEFPAEIKSCILSTERPESVLKQMAMDEVVLSIDERRVLGMLKSDEPVHIDHLLSRSKLNSGQLMAALLRLEMLDRIRQLPGKAFVKKM